MVFSGRVAIGGGVSSSSSADAASFVFDAAFDECGAVKEEDGVAFGAAPDCGVDQGKEKGGKGIPRDEYRGVKGGRERELREQRMSGKLGGGKRDRGGMREEWKLYERCEKN